MFGWFKSSKPDNELVAYLLNQHYFIKGYVEDEIVILTRNNSDSVAWLHDVLNQLNKEIEWLRNNIKNQEIKYEPTEKDEDEERFSFIIHNDFKGFPREMLVQGAIDILRACQLYVYCTENDISLESELIKRYTMRYISKAFCPNSFLLRHPYKSQQDEWLTNVEVVELHDSINNVDSTYRYDCINKAHKEAIIEDTICHMDYKLNKTNMNHLMTAIKHTSFHYENFNIESSLTLEGDRWTIKLATDNPYNNNKYTHMVTSYKKEKTAQDVYEQCRMVVDSLKNKLA